MPKLDNKKRAKILAGAAVVGLTIAGFVEFTSDDYNAQVNVVLQDAGVSRTTGSDRITDLLTGPVEPGDQARAVVSLPPGSTVDDVLPAGGFVIVSQGTGPRGEYVVTVRNDGLTTQRFMGFISYTVPATPSDGGS